MAVKIIKKVKKPVEASVEVEKNKTVVKSEQIPVGVFDESKPTANLGFSAAYTKNLGNYESLKVTVSLYMPAIISLDPAKEESNEEALEAAFTKVQGWVDKKMNELLEELNE